MLRVRLHYQTSMKPLYVPLPLYRSLYRRLLFPPAPKRQRRLSPAEEVATAASGTAAPGGGEPRCCCCSSEEAFSGADDPDSDACGTSNMSSSCTGEINSSNASSDRRPSISNNTCRICRERQRARAGRTSKKIFSTPCAFFAQQTGLVGGPSGGTSGGSWYDPGSVSCGALPEDLWEVTLQFSLSLQVCSPVPTPDECAGFSDAIVTAAAAAAPAAFSWALRDDSVCLIQLMCRHPTWPTCCAFYTCCCPAFSLFLFRAICFCLCLFCVSCLLLSSAYACLLLSASPCVL